MSKYQLIKKIDLYISFFNKRSTNDPLALAMIETLNKFKQEANGNPPKIDKFVQTALGYTQLWRRDLWEPPTLTQNNCIYYLMINKFINEINELDSDLAPKMFYFFNQFKRKALTPALYKFKELELQLSPEDKEELQAMFDKLNVLLEQNVSSYTEQPQSENTTEEESDLSASEQGVKATASKGADAVPSDLEDIIAFMAYFRKVLKDNPSIPELIELNQKALEAEQAALNLPEIKEIKEYHWIINKICNLINQYICTAFTSQATKNIQGFFGELNQKSMEKKEQLDQVEAELLKEAHQQFRM